MYWKHKGQHIEGTIIGTGMTLIFLFRFFIEFLKQDQVAFEASMKLNMGQLLSIPFIIAGIIWFFYAKKQNKRAVIIRKEKK